MNADRRRGEEPKIAADLRRDTLIFQELSAAENSRKMKRIFGRGNTESRRTMAE
jgi:hypothetical protein